MKFQSYLSKADCVDKLQWGFKTYTRVEEDRYTGWVLGSLFSVSLLAGDETRKNFYPVSNKALGILKETDGKAFGSCLYFMGLTDPISLLMLLAVAFVVLFFVRGRYGFGLDQCLLWSAVWAALVGLVTYLYTTCSKEGKLSTQKLREYMESSLGMERDEDSSL